MENKIEKKIEKREVKIELNKPLTDQLTKLHEEISRLAAIRTSLLQGYLIALGWYEYSEIEISPDFTFLTLTKKDKKNDKRNG